MAEITAKLVKELREKSGVGMMDAKKALVENNGDMEASMDWLRTKGLAKAAKKADRVAAEGLVAINATGTRAAVIEVNSETDFVARNEQFQTFVSDLASIAADANGNIDALAGMTYPGSEKPVSEVLTDNIATIGENMSLRRVSSLSVEDGVIATYMHNAVVPNLGKIGVLVAMESSGDTAQLELLGSDIAKHVAAMNPAALNQDSLDQNVVDRERAVLTEQARESGRPEEVIAKMIEGRMAKFLKEVCLVEQPLVTDPDGRSVKDCVSALAKELGTDVTLKGYIRMQLGDGIEKKEENFAEEVAAAAGR